MDAIIRKHIAFSESGQRSSNQDRYWIAEDRSAPAGIYVVCDGVGGQNRGDVAAELVAKHLPWILEHCNGDYVQAFQQVRKHFRDFIDRNPAAQDMATTTVFVHQVEDGIQLGWIGDSRIYHVRDGQVLFRTRDHSLVQTWVDKGELTEEEARTHPMSHVITRVVNGHSPLEPDLHLLRYTDLETGDWLFLCTDGVMEAWPDDELAGQFTKSRSLFVLKETITERCRQLSKDNYTGLILEIEMI